MKSLRVVSRDIVMSHSKAASAALMVSIFFCDHIHAMKDQLLGIASSAKLIPALSHLRTSALRGAITGIIVILFFLLMPKNARPEEVDADLQPQNVIAATEEEIRAGIAVILNGRLHFLQIDAIPGDFFTVKTDEGDEIHISLIKEQKRNTELLFIPVQIEDKVLARGVTLRLISPEGTPAFVKIPPNGSFFPFHSTSRCARMCTLHLKRKMSSCR